MMQTEKRKKERTILRIAAACSCAWAVDFHFGICAVNRGQGWIDLILTASLYLLLSLCFSCPSDRKTNRYSAVLSTLFTLLLSAGGAWMEHLRYDSFTSVPIYTAYYLNAYVGTWILLYAGIRFLLNRTKDLEIAESPCSPARWFWLPFLICVLVWLIFLLNQYPGSMESDHMRQLQHLLDGKLENRNPLVSSLLVYGCYSAAKALGMEPNAGIFLYSILQILMLAAVFGYGVFLLAREGAGRGILIAVSLFCALVPYNVFYSYGMWKDTLFAILLLLTVLQCMDLYMHSARGDRIGPGRYILLSISALFCGLSRNSGLLSLAMLILFGWFLLKDRPFRKVFAVSLLAGLAASILISGPVFRALGIELSSDLVYASCVPLQQVGRAVADGKELTEEERSLLEKALDLEAVRDTFDPECADPMKDAVVNASYISENKAAFMKTWLQIGFRHPLTYYRAYRDLMRMYYDPNVSSEVSYRWIYPNTFGVYRDPKLLPSVDLAFYEQILEFPAINLLKRPGALLWGFLILISLCLLRKQKELLVFLIPFLGVYFGLFLTAPVALFRYVYSCFAAAPFLFLMPFLRPERKGSRVPKTGDQGEDA